MNFYQRHIGDYAKKAGRLTMLQHGAYTNLLDACYDRERFPTEDEAIEWCWADTEDEKDAVLFVLRRFFVLVDGKYTQTRIQEEIDSYRIKSQKNKEIAIERERRKHDLARGVHASCKIVNLTNNQEPRTNKEEKEKDCAELQSSTSPTFIEIPLVSDQVHSVTEQEVAEYTQAYPAVDVRQTLRHMRQWCLANPRKRKTARGVRGFIASWFGREQDKGVKSEFRDGKFDRYAEIYE